MALDDVPGVRLVSNPVDVDPASVPIGLPVEVVREDVRPGLVLPRFHATP